MFDRLALHSYILSCLLCELVPIYTAVCNRLKISYDVVVLGIVSMFKTMGFILTGPASFTKYLSFLLDLPFLLYTLYLFIWIGNRNLRSLAIIWVFLNHSTADFISSQSTLPYLNILSEIEKRCSNLQKSVHVIRLWRHHSENQAFLKNL